MMMELELIIKYRSKKMTYRTINHTYLEYYFIDMWIESWPWWRKILCIFFDRYKGTEKEYKEWLGKKYFLWIK